MPDVSIVIPNYNGAAFLAPCLDAVLSQEGVDPEILVVDNGSADGSCDLIRSRYPGCQLVCLDQNYGFCRAVNEGFRRASCEYVILLNNDTEACPDFAVRLLEAVKEDPRRFSCQARMLRYQDRGRLDNAGDFYCALGWALTRGRGKPEERYGVKGRIFSSCGGAAIYRRSLVRSLGGFDEAHFAYLEDMDISWRARRSGYENWYAPEARVFHVGSATSGSRYNRFKVLHSAGNNIYLLYKNMPLWQLLVNAPLLLAGFLIKYLFFAKKGLGRDYLEGLGRGVRLCRANRGKRGPFGLKHFFRCLRIQLELWGNLRFLLDRG